jgi:hypothetical protein
LIARFGGGASGRMSLFTPVKTLFTREIFSLTRPANLSLHNYTIFQDVLALPLLGTLGVVTTFNVIYLLMIVITGYAAFRLAWHATGHPYESWLAGVLFITCGYQLPPLRIFDGVDQRRGSSSR